MSRGGGRSVYVCWPGWGVGGGGTIERKKERNGSNIKN